MISLDVREWALEPHVANARLILNISREKAGVLPPLGTRLDVTIQNHRKKRSLTANSYCWVLCDEIAKAVRSDKEDIYRMAIKAVGVFASIRIRNEAADRFIAGWQTRGTGWVAEKAGADDRFAYVNAYYGSSTYSTNEMARLIDWLVEEAKGLGIDTMTPNEKALMLARWRDEEISGGS